MDSRSQVHPRPALLEPLAASVVRYRTQKVGAVEVFYREAGPVDAPVLLLLHGFPSAGHMFRDLIPELADRYHVIAPDLPGFGKTTAPPHGQFSYTFDGLADVVGGFVDALELRRYALYIFDYGAPVGLRLAMKHPERITAIISQNGNAYLEGFSDNWGPWQAYWREPSEANREACRESLSPKVIREFQYGTGAEPTLLSPDGCELDIAYMARPGAEDIQLDLILDYRSNVALYPAFQAYFREHRPPLLAVWGRHDPAFIPAGAQAYARDLPDAEIHLLDAGHFALETHSREIAARIREFLARQGDEGTRSMTARNAVFPPERQSLYERHRYSPAIRSNGFLFVSGQVGSLADGSPQQGLKEQVRRAFENLSAILAAAGCSFENVVDVTVFMVDPQSTFEEIWQVVPDYWGEAPHPTLTAVGVTWLSGFDFEIKVIAKLP